MGLRFKWSLLSFLAANHKDAVSKTLSAPSTYETRHFTAIMNNQHKENTDGKGEGQEKSLPSDPMEDPEEIRVVLNTLNSFLYVRIPTALRVRELLLPLHSTYHIYLAVS